MSDQQAASAAAATGSRKTRSGGTKSDATTAKAQPPEAPAMQPDAPDKDRQDLLLWALANGLEPADGWFRSAQLTRRDLNALSHQHHDRYAQLRLLEIVGRTIERRHLEVLLKARLAEMLLSAAGPKELTEISRVFEKLPDNAALAEAQDDPDADIDGLDLAGAMNEARRLLGELESDPEVKRLLAQTNNNGTAEGSR